MENNYFTRGLNQMLEYLQQRGRITPAEYDQRFVAFSAMTIDTASRGFEVELVGNPTPNWTFRAGYSYTQRQRENYFAEREPFLGELLAFIRARDDRGVMTGGLTVEQAIAALQEDIQSTADSAEGSSTGARPAKANLTSRYRFVQGRLKGVYVGGALAFQSAPLMQKSGGRDLWGNDVRQLQLFGGQTFRLPALKAVLRLQLNVNNVLNSDVVDPGRYNNQLTALRRVYLRPPRNYRVTATFDF